jgi:Mrp family chromosome partitioning ATPase
MTTLDQAFIKAYLQQEETPRLPLRSSEPVRLDDAIGALSAAEPTHSPSDVAAARLARAVADALGNRGPATATIGWSTTGKPPATASAEATCIDAAVESTPLLEKVGPVSFVALLDPEAQAETLSGEARSWLGTPVVPADRMPEMVPNEPPDRSDRPVQSESREEAERPAVIDIADRVENREGLAEEARTAEVDPSAVDERRADHRSKEHREQAAAAKVFRPLLRVERLKWPSDCDHLDREAAGEVDRLANSLLAESAAGRNVLGFGAGGLNEGTTTLLLCAARRLAARGVKVVMVDADFDHPCLALRLRLAVQSGWEDALADRVPLDEVVIESDHDGLALLPWREPCLPKEPPAAGEADPAPSIRLLSQRYDLVLVDLGKLDDETLAGMSAAASPPRWIDAVILVHNVRDIAPADLDRLRHRVRTCGLAEAGVAENFA